MKDDLTPEQEDRLAAACRTFDHPDGVARARLLAALPAGGPPAQDSSRQGGWTMVRKIGIRAALAASLAVAAVMAWQVARPRSVFARAAAAMIEARGFRCALVVIMPGGDGREESHPGGSVRWSPDGGSRLEQGERGAAGEITILPPARPGLGLLPRTKQYRILPKDRDPEFASTLFAHLANTPAPAGPPLETREVDGRRANRYEIPWTQVAAATDRPGARLRIWLDAATNLPVRADLLDFGGKGGPVLRLESFRWGEQDPTLFATAPPEGYTKLPTVDARGDEIIEHIIYGLRTFAKYNKGRYPAVRYVYGDEQGNILRDLIGVGPQAQGWVRYDKDLQWKDPKEKEFAFGSSAMSWINVLQRENPDCAYNGKTVTPQDAGRVLLRWQLDDGGYRVIYGDLRTEVVTAARLKELEAR